MKSNTEKIYIKHWLDIKPYNTQTVTDSYYLQICNKVKNAIIGNKHAFMLNLYLENTINLSMLACFLTSYFEDLVSETNIWNTFVNHHIELYNKPLPFFDVDDYYTEEINVQDVSFLIWYFLNMLQEDEFVDPINACITETAVSIMDVFDEIWEYAPQNEKLKSLYTIDEGETDYYVARDFIDTILFKSYLFYPDTMLDLKESELELMEDPEVKENIIHFLNENRDQTLHSTYTRLLCLKGKDWASKIVGNDHPLSKDFSNISQQKIRGFFLYKGQDENDVFLEHIASGKQFNLTKKSFDDSELLQNIDTIIFIGIVKWRDEWWFSGVFFINEFNADLVLDEKNSLQSRMEVNFLDHQSNDVEEILEKQYSIFKDFTNGKEIVFLDSEKVDSFIKEYTEYYNKSLKLSKKERDKAKKRARKDGFFGTEDTHSDFTEVSESALIFFNPKSGVEVALAVNSAFPAPHNPFFNVDDSEEHLFRLFMNESISTELVMYCIENYKSIIPFFNKIEGKVYLENIDFLLRFWKQNNYYTKPSITFTGGSKSFST
ncbi:MAG: DUF3843 family protein [Bacteroidales bacterium]